MSRSVGSVCIPNADVLAADARVVRFGVCEDGCVLLTGAMWEQLHKDLAHHIHEAYRWLNTPQFAEWVTLCGGRPDAVRNQLLDDYWRVSA